MAFFLRRSVARARPQQRGSAFESSSAKIFKSSKANKRGFAKALDGTLRDGSHNMKTFGIGFLRSVAGVEAYGHFATALYHVYKAMEDNLDAQPQETGISRVWQGAPELRRAEALGKDLAYLGLDPTLSALSPATQEYVDSIHNAAKEDSALLLGHFYCRYFADLFGGSMLGYPTKVAVGLPEEYPAFYNFPEAVSAHRQEYIEGLYEALNEEGEKLCQDTQAAVVGETKKAFALNANLYTEVHPKLPGFYTGAVQGVARVAAGSV